MQEIFFFSKSTIEYSDIIKQAQNLGYKTSEYIESTSSGWSWSGLHIIPSDLPPPKGIPWNWHKVNPQTDIPFEGNSLRVINDYQPSTSFMISFRYGELNLLLKFLRSIMEIYGGWAACDGGFEQTYTLENLEDMPCEKNAEEFARKLNEAAERRKHGY